MIPILTEALHMLIALTCGIAIMQWVSTVEKLRHYKAQRVYEVSIEGSLIHLTVLKKTALPEVAKMAGKSVEELLLYFDLTQEKGGNFVVTIDMGKES